MEQQTLRLNVLVAAGLVAWYLSALLTTMHLVGVVFAGGVFGLVMLAYFWILGLVRSDTRVGGFFASSTSARVAAAGCPARPVSPRLGPVPGAGIALEGGALSLPCLLRCVRSWRRQVSLCRGSSPVEG